MIELCGITKSFGGRSLFAKATLRIGAQARIGLVGPNGAGKTTLLRIIAKEEPADDGEVRVPRGQRVGLLPQELCRVHAGTVLERVLSAAEEERDLSAQLLAVEASLSRNEGDVEALTIRHAELSERLRTLGAATLEPRALSILSGLGFRSEQLHTSVAALSGGWAMRVELARLLLFAPDVLLLDEPTNHLDLASLTWFEQFLESFRGGVVVVSHDRYLLNRLVDSIAELSADGVLLFAGNYDDYTEARTALATQWRKEQQQRERRINELQSFVERFGAKATKARQAQSKRKELARLSAQGADTPPPPKRHKHISLGLPQPPRSGTEVVTLTNVRKSFGEHVVFSDLQLVLRRGDKVALVGENGAGKSTLLRLLAGVTEADSGTRTLGQNVAPYYFAQHQAEALNLDATVLETLRTIMPSETETRVRGILGAFLFTGDAVDKHVAVLSGGEKSRLALACMLAKPTNLLLLDEPTNHLDLDSRAVLEAALADFAATICFVSHDRYFINAVASKVVEVHTGGELQEYLGDYEYYQWKRAQLVRPVTSASEVAPQLVSSRAQAREAQKAAAREARRRNRRTAEIEEAIVTSEQRLAEIDAALCEPDTYTDDARCRALAEERGALEKRIAELYEQWEEVEVNPPA